jgi:TRIAD3 protein (E3 ubiquitin-protein ligase RNF216)
MKSYASNLLGRLDPKINCIDRTGCAAAIPESELGRFLPEGMMKLWERVRQRVEIEAAGLGGLEECPFCDYAVILEDAEDKLLRCNNTDVCGVVSCRACKKSVSKFLSQRFPLLILSFLCTEPSSENL